MSRILAPVCLLAGIILSVLSYLFNKDVAEAVSTFTAIMCVSAPLTSTIAANLPLYRMSAKLIPAGAMVSGYSAVDAFSRTEAVVLDAKDLFRPSDIILHGIKPFDKSQIDSVILDAASVVCNTDGMLTDVFNKIKHCLSYARRLWIRCASVVQIYPFHDPSPSSALLGYNCPICDFGLKGQFPSFTLYHLFRFVPPLFINSIRL